MKHRRHLLLPLLCLLVIFSLWSGTSLAALRVQVHGITDPKVKKNVTASLQSLESDLPTKLNRAIVVDFYDKGRKRVITAMEPFGYFKSEVARSLTFDKGDWIITYTVTPGPLLRIARVDLQLSGEGELDPAFYALQKKFPLKAGQVLETPVYENAKQLLFSKASTWGYFDAKMQKSKIIINLNTYNATIIIHFYTGPRYKFGKTSFSQTVFNPKFLERFLHYKKGNYYNNTDLQKTQAALAGSGYFQQAVANPFPNEAINREVPINIHLEMQKQRQYILGAGFGTDTGIRGTAGVNYRWVNSWGHRFEGIARVSANDSNVTLNYSIPGPHPINDQFVISATGGKINQKAGDGQLLKGGLAYTTLTGNWQQTFALYALRERYNFAKFPTIPNINSNVVYPIYRLQHAYNQLNLNPSSGYNFIFTLAGASKSALSKTSFVQARAHAKILFTVLGGTRFLLRGEAGYTDIRNVLTLPLSLQLLAGGTKSVRGYSYNSIGPGRSMVVGSVEIQQRIIGGFYIAAFYDVGNVANTHLFRNMFEGAGPAIVFLSPLGAAELSFAQAISDPKKRWRIQFSIGPSI